MEQNEHSVLAGDALHHHHHDLERQHLEQQQQIEQHHQQQILHAQQQAAQGKNRALRDQRTGQLWLESSALAKGPLVGVQDQVGDSMPQAAELALAHSLRQIGADGAQGQALAQDYDEGGQDDAGDTYMAHLSTKRLADELSPPLGLGVSMAEVGREKKRRKTTTEQQLKRHKYDILKAFFRVYFADSKEGMVLKDAIYNLYAKKIPSDHRIARNAMYRHMWSFFRDKISAFQSNYREYIKGIKLLTSEAHLNYDGVDKDLELLSSVGVSGLFDYTEEDLEKNEKTGFSPVVAQVPPSGYVHTSNGDESLLAYIEQLEQTAKSLVVSLRSLKNKLGQSAGVYRYDHTATNTDEEDEQNS